MADAHRAGGSVAGVAAVGVAATTRALRTRSWVRATARVSAYSLSTPQHPVTRGWVVRSPFQSHA
jgi:hypothetical protein